jgi:hypothetical protein
LFLEKSGVELNPDERSTEGEEAATWDVDRRRNMRK